MSIALAVVMSLVLGSEASAAKPIFSTVTVAAFPNIRANGEVNTEDEYVPMLVLVEVYYKRGYIEIDLEAYGEVLNASWKRVKITDPTNFERLAIDDEFDVIVKDFSYIVTKQGDAKFKACILTDADLFSILESLGGMGPG